MSAATETGEPVAAPAVTLAAPRPFYWSVRRELWEHRSLYIAPLVAAAIMIAAVLLNVGAIPEGLGSLGDLDPAHRNAAAFGFYSGFSTLIVFTMILVAAFYSLDALHAERRDRSILFWKSMPVSDLTTVLAKLFTATVVAPAIAFVVIILAQLLVLLIATATVLAAGVDLALLWGNAQFLQAAILALYALMVLSLWFAPLYAWLLLVSSWAKRALFLWAVLPPLAIALFERMAFGTSYFMDMLRYRLQGGLASAFVERSWRGGMVAGERGAELKLDGNFPDHLLQSLTPVEFLSNPWLWAGLAVAAAFVGAAVWMRRYREPL